MNIIDKYKLILKQSGLSKDYKEMIQFELDMIANSSIPDYKISTNDSFSDIFIHHNDFKYIIQKSIPSDKPFSQLKTLDELLENDKKREADGFPRRIKLGKLVKPSKDKDGQIIIVPTTTEPKFYHDDSITEDGESGETGGSGEGEEGQVIGQQPAQPQGEGEGEGAGQGESSDHDISQDAFDLGKIITEKLELPNIKDKGKKVSQNKYTYQLTDRNRRFGQILEKKATIKKIVETNIMLGNIEPSKDIDLSKLIINPNDQIFRILSKEKDYENQAVVFFVRDYSGSMQGKPTEAITTQHLLIYSWLMYQYKNNLITRFILHDTEAKEVPDFYTYYQSQIAGGTNIYPAFELINKIIEEEQLVKDYNIYIFHGTDGDDWDETGAKMIPALKQALTYANRVGITIAKNNWSGDKETIVEKYLEKSELPKNKPELLRVDAFNAETATEERLIASIKHLIS